MATVYLAHDIKHDRKVALKVLRPELAAVIGAARFLAEIRTTANLQHPHILPLHDSGEVDGTVFYVMPFVEGESLRDRLNREKQLPIDDAVRITKEVASALDYAHRHDVIHRDIKPENILLHDGTALVADFGIALAAVRTGAARMTETGMSLGTPTYMSPEQAMGERTLDARTDIYALGCVLYEMLTGEPPFTGPTAQAIVAKVMTDEPRSPTQLRRTVPGTVEAVVLRALQKLPADRFSSAAELTRALEHGGGEIGPVSRQAPGVWRTTALVLAVVNVALAGSLAWFAWRSREATVPTLTARLTTTADAPSDLRYATLSPDGSRLAYVSSAAADGGRIWLRRMSDGVTSPIAETEGARQIFWSPDGTAIGFFSAGVLRVATIATGAVRALAPAPNSAGAAWSSNGTIVYSPFFGALWRVPATGGEPRRALLRTYASGQGSREPSFLPDGRHFIYWQSGDGSGSLWLGDLETGDSRELAKRISSARYVEPGYVLFFQAETQARLEEPAPLFAQRFDVRRLTLEGEPVMLSPRVDRPDQGAIFSASRDLLVMREAAPTPDQRPHSAIYWLDRSTGRSTPINGAGPAWTFRISHRGDRVAFGGGGLWLHDPARDVAVRLRTKAPLPWPPVWSPDDKEIAVVNGNRISIVRVDGGGDERVLVTSEDNWTIPVDWALDASAIYYVREPSESRPHWDLWRHVLATSTNEAVLGGPGGNVLDARLSPDGKWIAWESDASGRREVYVSAVDGGRALLRVSKAGGGSPHWRADGRELFYIAGDGRINVVGFQAGPNPTLSEPRTVTTNPVNPEPFGHDSFQPTRFDVSPLGDRFIVQTPPDVGAYSLTLIQGWQTRLRP
jgi:serine/threonine-protein kinase